MSRFYSMAYPGIIFLFLLLVGVQSHKHNPCSDQILEFGKDTDTSKFKANSRNCTEYTHTVRILGVAGKVIRVQVHEYNLRHTSYVELADYVVENGKELIVKRKRFRWNWAKMFLAWVGSENCSALIVFHKDQNDEEETPREEHYEADFRRYDYSNIYCPYPWKSFTGSLNVTNDGFRSFPSFDDCAMKVDVPAGNIIKGVSTTPMLTVYDSDEVFVGEPLMRGREQTKTFLSRTNSITIIYRSSHAEPLHLQLTEEVKDCSCFPTAFSLSSNSSVVSLLTPGFPQGGCPDVLCQTKISTNAIVTRENNYHVEFKLSHQIEVLPDTVQFNIGGTTLDFKEFDTNQERSFCFANKDPISFTYRTSKEHVLGWGGMNVSMRVIQMPPECVCPSASTWSLDINIPKSCPEMDCLWTLITNANSIYSIDFDQTLFPEEELLLAIKGVSAKYSFPGLGEDMPANHESIEIRPTQTVRAWYKRNPFSTRNADTRLRIDIREKDCICRGGPVKVPATGTITFNSPNWPFNYCNNMNCRYEFIAPKNYIVKLKIHSFSTDENDALTLFDGARITGRHLDRLAGWGSYEFPFATTSNVLTALFRTNDDNTNSGYNATVFAEYDGEGDAPSSSPSSSFSLAWILFSIIFFCVIVSLIVVVIHRQGGSPQLSSRWVMFVNDQESNVVLR